MRSVEWSDSMNALSSGVLLRIVSCVNPLCFRNPSNRLEMYWLPLSDWKTNPGICMVVGALFSNAMVTDGSLSAVMQVWDKLYPIQHRSKQSRTLNKYAFPSMPQWS